LKAFNSENCGINITYLPMKSINGSIDSLPIMAGLFDAYHFNEFLKNLERSCNDKIDNRTLCR